MCPLESIPSYHCHPCHASVYSGVHWCTPALARMRAAYECRNFKHVAQARGSQYDMRRASASARNRLRLQEDFYDEMAAAQRRLVAMGRRPEMMAAFHSVPRDEWLETTLHIIPLVYTTAKQRRPVTYLHRQCRAIRVSQNGKRVGSKWSFC